jgi:proliferating cell nuclear antigen
MSKIVRIQTEHSSEIKTLFEVLKEVLNEVKIDFLRSDTQTNEPPKKKTLKNDEDEDDESEKKPLSKTLKKKKNVVEDDESETESIEKKPTKKGAKQVKGKEVKPVKEIKKKSKVKEESEDEEDEDDDEESKSKSKELDKKSNVGGIRIMALDDNQLLLIYVKLNPTHFLDFYVKPECHSVGLDLTEFHKFIKTIDKDSQMSIYIDKDDEQNIVFELQNEQKGHSSKYKQKLLDIDDNSKQLPIESNFHMSVMMDTIDFKKICSEMSQFSEYVEITCTCKEITFKCRGDSNAYERTFENSQKGVRIMALKKDGPPIFQAIYNLKHLVTFGRCTNLCTEMQLYLKNDYPLFIYFTIGTLGKLLVGLSPVDGKIIKKDNDYNEANDKYYQEKKILVKG